MSRHDGFDTGEDRPVGDEEPFARRWSRRKHRATESAGAVEPAAPQTEGQSDGDGADGDKPVLTDADMPPVEALTEDADVSGFFSEGVSEFVRQAALRRLFHMPKFQLRDGLDDYDDDLRSFTPLGDIVTSDMRLQAERRRARERALAANDELAEPAADEADHAVTGADAAREDPTGGDETLLARGAAVDEGAGDRDGVGEADGD